MEELKGGFIGGEFTERFDEYFVEREGVQFHWQEQFSFPDVVPLNQKNKQNIVFAFLTELIE